MSGIKSIDLGNFYRSLHGRGSGVAALARALNCGRSHLSQVLAGDRPGTQTWRKLEKSGLLTDRELRLLGRVVPQETLSHVEQAAEASREGGGLLEPLRVQIAALQALAARQLGNFVEEVDGYPLMERARQSAEKLEYLAPTARDLRTEAMRADFKRDGFDTWHHKTRAKYVADLHATACTFDHLDRRHRHLREQEQAAINELRACEIITGYVKPGNTAARAFYTSRGYELGYIWDDGDIPITKQLTAKRSAA